MIKLPDSYQVVQACLVLASIGLVAQITIYVLILTGVLHD